MNGVQATLGATLRAAEARELKLLQRAIAARVGREPEALRSYRRAYERALAGPGSPVAAHEVVEAAAGADLVLVGDYHTLPAAQQAALALARALARHRPLVLGLEMVRTEHQMALDAYCEGSIATSALKNLIRYDAAWPFPWSSYGPLVELGREPGISLLALDGRGGLEARDRVTADRLAASRARHPEALHLALVGDLHLAPLHLPALLSARRPADRLAVVHQNIPAVYQHLAARGAGERAAAADLGGGHYCLITATPLTRERSYLAWLDGAEVGEVEPAEEVARIGDRLAALLGIEPLGVHVRGGVEVVVRGGAAFLRDLAARGLPFARLVGVRRQMTERAVAVVGPQGPVFVGQPDARHFAAAAAALAQARAGEPPVVPERPDASWREADLLAAVRRESFAVLAWRLVEPLAGAVTEPFAVAFDPAAGAPPVRGEVKVERRARALRARVAAELAGRRSFAVPAALLDDPAPVRAAVARAAGAHYADRLHDALLAGAVEPAAVAALLAPPGPHGRPRERRAVLALAALARAARRGRA